MEKFDRAPSLLSGVEVQNWNRLHSILGLAERLIQDHPQTFPLPLRAFSRENTREQFLSYPLEYQARTLEALDMYVKALSGMTDNLESPRNSKLFLWRALQKLKLLPADDLFEQIGDDEIIEVYSSHGVQMFRSFSLLEAITYSIEDLIVFSWDGLFYRNPDVTTSLMDQAMRLFTKQICGTQPNEVSGKHIVSETKSEERRKFEIEFGVVSPLKTRDYSETSYFVSTIKSLRIMHD